MKKVAQTVIATPKKQRIRKMLGCQKSFKVMPSTERSHTRPHLIEFALPPDPATLTINPLTQTLQLLVVPLSIPVAYLF